MIFFMKISILIFYEIFYENSYIQRVRENELLYVLKKLKSMRVWPGTLWAALSNDPSKYVNEQPGASLIPSEKKKLMMV